jgi:hypothetical protein
MENAASQIAESVISPPSVVHFRIWPLFQFFNETVIQKPADCAIESSSTQPDGTSGLFKDISDGAPWTPVSNATRM